MSRRPRVNAVKLENHRISNNAAFRPISATNYYHSITCSTFSLRISHSARSISSFGYGSYLEEKVFKRNFFSACVRKSIEIYIYFRDFIFERNIKCVINKKKKKDGRIFLFLTREKFVLSIE